MLGKKQALKIQDFCPRCYLENNSDVVLTYHPGSGTSHSCEFGHEYDDRELLAQLMQQASQQRSGKKPKAPDPVKQDIPAPSQDQTLVEAQDNKEDGSKPEIVDQSKGIFIGAVDFSRLSSIIGHFSDSSSLFGAVFALNQELLDTKEALRLSREARNFTAAGPTGGDVLVQVVVPEAHVVPMTDVAESNGMDLASYLSDRVNWALSNMWFY